MRRLRWHAWVCLAVGLASGALVGAVRSAWGPAYRDSTARTLSQDLFERGITAPPQANFRVSGLVVHPPEPDGVCWVTGTYSERGARGTREGPFKFRATRPYVPRLAVSSAEPGGLTVASYLNELAVRVPQAGLGYRYAWWERPGGAVALWTSTGALVGAVVGFLRRRNGAFVERCAEAGPAIASCDPAPEPCPEPVVAPQLAPRKAFGGEFYPTEIHPDPCHTPE
jgi:hypothetical protein